MSVKIRLKRMGSKKRPFYRMIVADERAPRDGRYIEELGYYNPLTKDLKLDNEKAQGWIEQWGAAYGYRACFAEKERCNQLRR